jgi:myo-inositol-1(or 4)-monophosphatase
MSGRSGPPSGDGPSAIDAIHDVAFDLARRCGEALLDYYARPLDVRFKSKKERDPVTEADEAIESLVRATVSERFPGHGVLGEEGTDSATDAEYLWVVDPLDGTANFANGLPIFAVSVAVLRFGAPVVAALFTTFGPEGRPCVLHARRGGGLCRDGLALPVQRRATGRARLSGVSAGFLVGFRYGPIVGMPPGETRSLGSIAAELGLVATGALQYAVFSSPKIWDVAAGVLLVVEGGGQVFVDDLGRWRPLNRFVAPEGRPLRAWHRAVVAGDAQIVPELVRRLHARHSPVEWAERLAGRRRVERAGALVSRSSSVARRSVALARAWWRRART